MILTSLQERNARGRAAETAARPPTRTKSSISVVTNKTLKKRPRSNANRAHARTGPVFLLRQIKGSEGRRRQVYMPGGRQNRFPGRAAQSRVTPRPKVRRWK